MSCRNNKDAIIAKPIHHVDISIKDSQLFRWTKQNSKQDNNIKLCNYNARIDYHEQRVSPLGKTDNHWNINNPSDGIFGHNNIQIVKHPELTEKESMAYTESWSNRIRCTKRQIHSKGVRISSRRFTTDSYKNKVSNEQSSYESDGVLKNRTSNPHHLTKLTDLKPQDCHANTPEKYSKTSFSVKNPKTSMNNK